eukprot:6227892-Amphidinium_carterae.1
MPGGKSDHRLGWKCKRCIGSAWTAEATTASSSASSSATTSTSSDRGESVGLGSNGGKEAESKLGRRSSCIRNDNESWNSRTISLQIVRDINARLDDQGERSNEAARSCDVFWMGLGHWEAEAAAEQKRKPLCAAGAPPPPPPKDEPGDDDSGEDLPDEAQVPHHSLGDSWRTRYGCFQGGRGQGKTACQACNRRSDMFSAFIFVTAKIEPESRDVQWNPAVIDDANFQTALNMTRGRAPDEETRETREHLLKQGLGRGPLGEEIRVKAQPGRIEPS